MAISIYTISIIDISIYDICGCDMKDSVMGKEMRKGFLKLIVLKIISERPIHGYDIIAEIESKTRGHWVPSPGSIYPALEFLESKGYIAMEEVDRKKVYTITEEGREALKHIDMKRRELAKEINAIFEDTTEENDDGRQCY